MANPISSSTSPPSRPELVLIPLLLREGIGDGAGAYPYVIKRGDGGGAYPYVIKKGGGGRGTREGNVCRGMTGKRRLSK